MLKRKLAGIILATTVVNLLNAPITVLAEEIKSKEIITESKEGEEESEITTAKIKKFSLFGSENLSKYDEMFKVDNSNIKAITNNGGNYGQSYINKAIDGNFNTFWETGRANASNFTNEVIIELNDITALNRIVYAARQDGAKGKGFAQEVEIYASTTSSDDDFKLVSSGSYLGSTGDIVEIKFNTTEFKRIKFKFVKANQGWASASEFILYKEDKIADSMENLFVDDSLSKVSEEFNTLEKIEVLEEKAKNHPLYKEYKESLENAKALVMDKGDIESEEAEVSKFNTYYTEYRDAYSKEFKMPNSNIKSITNNGGNYGSSSIKYAIDENIDTHWETGNPNSNNFKNEVIINLHDSVVLDRIIYKARNGGKGFAKSFEIYASTTTTGDTFKKVANGSHNVTNDLIQIKFKPTEFRRVKFVFTEANENWASASEFMLYKEDKIDEEVNRIFVDNTMSSVIEEFNNIDKLNDLDNRAKSHPLYNEYKERLNLAKEIVSNPNKLSNTVWKLERRGNSIKESQKRKVWNFQDWQPTGYRVKSGDVINVYVDVENGKPTPEIVFKQMDSQHNGQVHIKLSNGKNTITIPELSSDELRPGTSKAGVLYTSNQYTPEEQGRMPKIRIEGAERYPHYIKGIDNDNDVIRELEEYVQLLSEDASLPDVFDVFSEKTLVNVKATYALDWYKNNNKLPSYTANKSDEVIKETMRFWGFDESSEVNSDFNFRYISMVKWLDNGGFMNAGNGITGVNKNEQGALLGVNTGWGLMHEMGHNFDTNNRTIGEVTNNILPLHFQKINGEASKITAQNLWEKNILPKVALDDYSQNEYYPESDKSLLSHIAPLWQLQLYNEEFWPEFERKFRASSFKGGSWELIHDEWVKVASDVLELDLYEHFARHGLRASEDVKKYTSKYSKPTKKLWYINDKIYLDNGGAFTDNVNYSISSIKSEDNKVKLQIEMDEENIKNTLGFEIFRDGETIGFTSGNTFVDNGAIEGKNHEYKVIAYDKEINPNSEATAKLHDLRISVDENITVELNSIFNPINYVSALNYKNEDIGRDVKVIKNTVDTGSKGFYEVVYEITSEGTTKTKISEVEVVSKANYLSDIKEVSATTGWRTLQKDKAPDGSPIKLYRDSIESAYVKGLGAHANSSIVYSIEGQGYTKFKSYVGIQAGAGANASATFEVYLDGEKVYDSGLIKDGDNYKYVDINVSGAKELRLVTTDSGNGNAADHTIWAEAKLTTNNTKPTIIAEDKVYKIGDEINILDSINAYDVEDGDLTSKIKIKSSNYEEGKLGNFKVTYEVVDSDNNLIEKTINITVYDILDVKKSYYGKFDNLNKYNEEFKIKVKSVSNNGGNYGTSSIDKAIDGNVNVHWETGKPNSNSFKNEVVFELNELTKVDRMAYKSRNGGKGFASKFEVYVSESINQDDFYKVGEGTYTGSVNDVIEFNLNGVEARRVKFVFVEAIQDWASIGEMAFYSEDVFAKKILNELFTTKDKVDVTEKYNTLEKLESLREEAKAHPAATLFEEDLNKAEVIIRSKFPQLEIPKSESTKLGLPIDLTGVYIAMDSEDGDITNNVVVSGLEHVNFNKTGVYKLDYTIQDSDGNITIKSRNINVVDMEDYTYLSDVEWKSTHNTYGDFKKDKSYSNNTIRLTGQNGEVVSYEKGLGTHSNGTVIYDLTNIKADYFTSYIGVDRVMYNTVGSVNFQVYLDGNKVYDSGLMISTDKQKFVEIDLRGAKELKLVMTDGGNGNGSDHGNWADAKLHYANTEGEEVDRVKLDNLIEEINKLNKNDYIEDGWNNLTLVKDKVNLELSNGYNQKEIDSLYEELNSAKNSLEKVTTYEDLISLVESIKEFKEYLYTNDSWNTLLISVNKANYIIENNNSTNTEVNAMIDELNNSIKNLEERVDKKELNELVQYADSITDISFVGANNHVEARWNNFIVFRDLVKEVLFNTDANERETRNAIFQLTYFIEELQIK